MIRSCIFCGDTGSLTREHIIPAWLARYVKGELTPSTVSTFRGVHLNFSGEKLSERVIKGDKHTAKIVCGRCNNGWMSRLEMAFAKLLPKLMMGQNPSNFSLNERRAMTIWLVKTGIMAQWSANYRRILPDDFPLGLKCGEILPSGISSFAAKKVSDRSIGWCQGNLKMLQLRNEDYSSLDVSRSSFVFSIGIVDTLLVFTWHSLDENKYTISSPMNDLSLVYPHPCPARVLKVFSSEHEALAGLSLTPI